MKSNLSTRLACAGILLAVAACSAEDAPAEPVCGDSRSEYPGEQCDDGNLLPGDGCNDACEMEPGWSCGDDVPCATTCGDQIKAGTEACDHQATTGQTYCLSDCSAESGSCGDGILQRSGGAAFSDEHCDTGPQESPGCVECHTAFAWLCSGEPSQCAQTGLPPGKLMTDLVDGDIQMFCLWLTGFLGGKGAVHYCRGTQFTVYSPEACANNIDLEAFGACTVGGVEQFAAAQGSACAFLTAAGSC